jgi:rhodanese-related sulfurtransferase
MRHLKLLIAGLFIVLFQSLNAQVISEGLSVKEFQSKIITLNNEQLIDVRTPEEFDTGYIYKAKLINFRDANFKEQLSKLDKKRPVLVYCAAGGRSNKTRNMLVEMGFKEIYELEGGFTAWADTFKE